MGNFIYSTLTTDVCYNLFDKKHNDLPPIIRKIEVKGGANLMNDKKRIDIPFMETPEGRVTEVTDEELAILKENTVFQIHVKNGFIKIDNKKMAVEKAVKDMEKKDKSAPLTPSDYPSEPKEGETKLFTGSKK